MSEKIKKDFKNIKSMAIGHAPALKLDGPAKTAFKTYQANLLSLISHELKTPMMGIMNSLDLFDQMKQAGEEAEISPEELISIARRNANRLHHALSSLLDLAAVGNGTYHVHLKEVDFPKIVKIFLDKNAKRFSDEKVSVDYTVKGDLKSDGSTFPVLGDPKKLERSVELCFETLFPFIQSLTKKEKVSVKVVSTSYRVRISFPVSEEERDDWKQVWEHAAVGFESGAVSGTSAFGGVLQSEEDFLSRKKEGLGSELMIVHEILRLHEGEFQTREEKGAQVVTLELSLPELSSREGLRAVMSSRIYEASIGLGSVALGLVEVPKGQKLEEFRESLRKSLFRASDAVYALPEENRLAIVMDDCRLGDAPRLVARVEKNLNQKLVSGIVTCPEEGSDPDLVMKLVENRLKRSQN